MCKGEFTGQEGCVGYAWVGREWRWYCEHRKEQRCWMWGRWVGQCKDQPGWRKNRCSQRPSIGHKVFRKVKWTLKYFFLPPLKWFFEAIIRGESTFGEVQQFKHWAKCRRSVHLPLLLHLLCSRGAGLARKTWTFGSLRQTNVSSSWCQLH